MEKIKKIKLSVTINKDLNKVLNSEKINKSKLINWLLEQHYKNVKQND